MPHNSFEIDIEIRIRLIYLFKSLIIAGIKESDCSSEAGMLLIEACDCALEESDSSLNVWTHVQNMIVNNYFLKIINLLMEWSFA